jgi:tetratricopeptide (TPR) repeat protein
MKKIVITALLAIAGLGSFAQKLDKAKDLLQRKKFTEAKTEIDNYLAIEKNQAASEGWYQKTKIYLAIAADSTQRSTVPNAREVAFESVQKYLQIESKEKDAAKKNLMLTLENNQPLIDIYSGFSKDAASYYNAGNFNDALTNFKRCLDVFALMSEKGLIPGKLDTTTTLYAGISAEKANKPDEAAVFYGKIAESKATGEGFVEIYKWLADFYRRKEDITNAKKFSTLGREVYPTDTFWSTFELDMTREKGSKDELFTKYEQVIKENPTGHLNYYNYGVELYQAGYDPEITKRPANSKDLIEKARATLKKTAELKPDYPNTYMVLGQMAYNEGVDFNNENKAIRPAQGARLTPEQTKKKDELRQQMVVKFDEAIPYFKKVDELLDSQGKLKMEDKETLKGALDLLIIANEEKSNQLEQRKNAAEAKKLAADVKKYEADIKVLQDEITKYTEKFNNVDRKH